MPQAAQLHDLRMVHEQVHVDPELANVPVVHFRVGRLEHDPLGRQLLHDPRHHVRPPRAHVLRDALGLDHQPLDTRVVQEPPAQVHQLARVRGADGFEARRGRVAARAELDAQLRFGFEAVRVDFVDQAEPVVRGDGEEAGGKLDDVEAGSLLVPRVNGISGVGGGDEPQVLALAEVLVEDGVHVRVREEMLGPAALVEVRERVVLLERKERERAGKGAHTVET